jgi:hypothetical protein
MSPVKCVRVIGGGPVAVIQHSPITEGKTVVTHYKVMLVKYEDDNETPATTTTITFDTQYTLSDDLPEWVREEVDPTAVVDTVDHNEALYDEDEDDMPSDGVRPETCKHGGTDELHECPYKTELYEDESLCNCCAKCENECAMDV